MIWYFIAGFMFGLFTATLFFNLKQARLKPTETDSYSVRHINPPANCRGEEMVSTDEVVEDIIKRIHDKEQCTFDE